MHEILILALWAAPMLAHNPAYFEYKPYVNLKAPTFLSYQHPAVRALPAFSESLLLGQPRGQSIFPGDVGVGGTAPRGVIPANPGIGIGGAPQGDFQSTHVHTPARHPQEVHSVGAPSGGPGGDGIYDFEYKAGDGYGSHSRKEMRDKDGRVSGYYIIALADGRQRVVEYIADEYGFRAKVNTNEQGTENQSPADVEWSSASTGPLGEDSLQPQTPSISKPPPAVYPPPAPTPIIEEHSPIRGATQRGSQIPPHQHIGEGIFPTMPARRIHLAPPRPIQEDWNTSRGRGSGIYLVASPQTPSHAYSLHHTPLVYTPLHRQRVAYIPAFTAWGKTKK